MSQQRPAPNPIVTVLLWAAIFFLGWQLFTGSCGQQQKSDTRTSEQVYQGILDKNKSRDGATIEAEVRLYSTKLNADQEGGRIDAKAVEEKLWDAELIKDHTLLAYGMERGDRGAVERAFQSLNGHEGKYKSTPAWQKEVAVAPYGERLPQTSVSATALHTLLIDELAVQNKSAKVVGYISGYHMMDWLVKLTGASPAFSYWFAALLLAIIVRLAVFPLAQKQYIWGRRMSQLAPYIKEIQEKFKDKKTGKVVDQQAMTMETMEVYKRYGFNPLAGCWPMLIQIPLFLIIYQCMLLYRFEFTKGYFLWIHPGSGSFLGVPLAPNLGEKDYIIILIYGVSMIVTTLLTPVSDPSNIRQQRMIGISIAAFFSIIMFFYPLPSAFIVYWVFTNILATAQSLYVYRMPVAPLEPVQTSAGGAIPTTGRDASNGKATVDPGFFGKTGKASAKRKKKK